MVDEIINTPVAIPDILTQVSKEKYRRRLLIASRLLAFFLILVIFWYGYEYYVYTKVVKPYDGNPCFLCGYAYGMQCTYVYNEALYKYNETEKEEFLLSLGKSNINQSTTKILGGMPKYDQFNISFFNISS